MVGNTPSQVSQWLSDQFGRVFPDWLKAMFIGQSIVTKLTFSENAHKVSRQNGHFVAPAIMLQSDEFPNSANQNRIVDAWLPKSVFLERSIEAPISAKKNLSKLVELDMVRRTPFRPETVFWITGKPEKTASGLRIKQWIAKRTYIEELRKRASRSGFRIRKVFIEGEPNQAPIADFSDLVTPNAKRWKLLNGALALVAIGLAATLWLYPAWQASVERVRLQESNTEYRAQALALRQEVDALRSREMERAAFLNVIYNRPRLSNTLRSLTVAMPDNVWISNMNFSPERLVASGEVSGSAAQLVLDLSKRNEFVNPRLTGPVARAGNGAERFELTLDLMGVK
ncbi:PilN domain-containing protein [Profundibacter sp.]